MDEKDKIKEEIILADASVFLEDLNCLDGKTVCITASTYDQLRKVSEDRNKSKLIRDSAKHALRYIDEHDGCVYYLQSLKDESIEDIYEVQTSYFYCNYIVCKRVNYDIKYYTSNWLSWNSFVKFCNGSTEITNYLFYIKKKPEPEYSGYLEVCMAEEDMAYFYEHLSENIYGLLANQYIIIKNVSGNVVDAYRWDGETHLPLKKENVKSEFFGTTKPYNGDIYQKCLFDSLAVNKITMVKGPAGSGKTTISIEYLMYLLEKHKIDKIISFANTIPTINTAKLGFYPGTRDSKLLESSIGNILSSKLGDTTQVERMIEDHKLLLIPMCDIRGFDTSGMRAGILITEAQNLDVNLMKLALQRVGDDSICIVDGDYNAQVDSDQYAGEYNGMRRLSKVFRGQSIYGEIELKNIYRSKIADIAERM